MLTVGDLLQQARTKKDLSYAQVEKATRIRTKYLRAIEKNNWQEFPSKVYITGIIRSYAQYLSVDPNKALAYFRRDYEKKDEVSFRRQIPSLSFLPDTKKIAIASIALVFLLFLGYFGYQLNLYLSPPSVQIVSPEQTVFRNTDKIRIVGQTDNEAVVKIFDESYFPDNNGRFVYDLPLSKGRNPITIKVTGANGRETQISQEYILE